MSRGSELSGAVGMGSRAIDPGEKTISRLHWVGELALRDDRLSGGTRLWLPGFRGGSS